jgi:hypothetical protein
MATGSFRSRQKECEASFHPTTHTSTHARVTPALPTRSFSRT